VVDNTKEAKTMKFWFVALFLTTVRVSVATELTYHYIPKSVGHSCGQTCESKNYLCSDKILAEMNCKKSAMIFCELYLHLDVDGEMVHSETGCNANCRNLYYFPYGTRTCDEGKSNFNDRVPAPEHARMEVLCKCYTEDESVASFFTQRVKIGLFFLFLSVGGFCLLEAYGKFTNRRSYIRSPISPPNLLSYS
jgi:hypothetical protein